VKPPDDEIFEAVAREVAATRSEVYDLMPSLAPPDDDGILPGLRKNAVILGMLAEISPTPVNTALTIAYRACSEKNDEARRTMLVGLAVHAMLWVEMMDRRRAQDVESLLSELKLGE